MLGLDASECACVALTNDLVWEVSNWHHFSAKLVKRIKTLLKSTEFWNVICCAAKRRMMCTGRWSNHVTLVPKKIIFRYEERVPRAKNGLFWKASDDLTRSDHATLCVAICKSSSVLVSSSGSIRSITLFLVSMFQTSSEIQSSWTAIENR